MYFDHRWEKLSQHFQTVLSEESKKSLQIFIAILQSTTKFLHFEEKDQLHSLNISKVVDPEKCRYLNAWKPLF